MKRAMMVLALCGLTMAVGCEEKKAEPVKAATPAPAPAPADAPKTGMDKAPDMPKAATDAVKTAGDAAKAAADKAQGSMTSAADVKAMVDKAKTQLGALTAGGAALSPDKKPLFDAAMVPLNDQFKALTDGASKLGGLSGGDLTSSSSALKDKASALMTGIKSVADKFGIKI